VKVYRFISWGWMEVETLRKLVRSDQDRLPMERNGLFRGLAEDELWVIFALLSGRRR
jgi:hypothetical protein